MHAEQAVHDAPCLRDALDGEQRAETHPARGHIHLANDRSKTKCQRIHTCNLELIQLTLCGNPIKSKLPIVRIGNAKLS